MGEWVFYYKQRGHWQPFDDDGNLQLNTALQDCRARSVAPPPQHNMTHKYISPHSGNTKTTNYTVNLWSMKQTNPDSKTERVINGWWSVEPKAAFCFQAECDKCVQLPEDAQAALSQAEANQADLSQAGAERLDAQMDDASGGDGDGDGGGGGADSDVHAKAVPASYLPSDCGGKWGGDGEGKWGGKWDGNGGGSTAGHSDTSEGWAMDHWNVVEKPLYDSWKNDLDHERWTSNTNSSGSGTLLDRNGHPYQIPGAPEPSPQPPPQRGWMNGPPIAQSVSLQEMG